MQRETQVDGIKESRIIILCGVIDDALATNVMLKLLELEKEDANKDIYLYINSPGGSITAGMAIYDTMQYIKPDVATVCYGCAASMGSFLLASGAKGKRFALPHSMILIHQPLRGFEAERMYQQSEIEIVSQNILKTRINMEEILAEQTGKSVEQIHEDCERDKYMSAEQALEYGLIDKILTKGSKR